jgi:hypothetical protein
MEKNLSVLRSAERASRYREFANEAIQKADGATDPAQRAECVCIASNWHALAVEAERIGAGLPSQMESRSLPHLKA